jgi:hypothetical protein
MDQKFEFPSSGNDRIVYVRPVNVSELPQDMMDQVGDAKEIYAIYAEDGQRLAFVRDRALAFAVARTNEFAPVSVH